MVQVIWQQEEMHEGEFHYDDEHDEVHVASSDLPHVHDGNVVVMIPTGEDSAYPQAGGFLSLNVDFYHYLLAIASFTNLSLRPKILSIHLIGIIREHRPHPMYPLFRCILASL